MFVFGVRPYLRRDDLKLGHWLLTLTFAAVGRVRLDGDHAEFGDVDFGFTRKRANALQGKL